MRSDHWNFLANLLGASNSSDSPKKKAAPKKPVAPSPEPETSKAESSRKQSSSDLASKETAPQPTEQGERPKRQNLPTPVTSKTSGDAPKSVEDVLDALRSATPPQNIPGFGPPKKAQAVAKRSTEAERPAETSKPAGFQDRPRNPVGTSNSPETPKLATAPAANEDTDQAWGSLANQLGVTVDDDFAIERSPSSESPSRQAPAPSDSRNRPERSEGGRRDNQTKSRSDSPQDAASDRRPSPAKSQGSGFGTGLDVAPSEDSGEDITEAFGAPRRRPTPAESRRDTPAPSRGRSERSRDVQSSDEPEGKFISKKSSLNDDDSETGERAPRRRGRRRGVRQRITEDQLERGEETPAQSEEKPRAGREASPRRGERNRSEGGRTAAASSDSGRSDSGRSDSGRGREQGSRGGSSRDSQRSPASDRDAGRRQRSPAKEAVEPSNRSGRSRPERAQDDDRDFEDGFASNLFVDDFDDDDVLSEDQDVDEPKAADRDEEAPRPRSRRRGRRGGRRGRNRDEANRPEDEAKNDDSVDTFAELPSFDDDHEDDDEADAIRREKRRPQSGRGSRGARDSSSRESSDQDESSESSSRSRGRGRRNASDSEGSADRPSAPTWLETVSLLVDANVENHKKTPARGSGGGGRGRGGKRR